MLLLLGCVHPAPPTAGSLGAATPTAPPESAAATPTDPTPATVSDPIAAPESGARSYLYAWPPPSPTSAQIEAVRTCAPLTTAQSRYPQTLGLDGLLAQPAHGACDQAVFAAACVVRLGDDQDPPAPCLDAWREAVRENPAFAHEAVLGFTYTPYVPTFAPPPTGPVQKLVVDYGWSGLGTGVKWTLTVEDGVAHAKGDGAISGPPQVDLAELGASFANFTPIPAKASLVNCYDNYPSWTATVTFTSGEELHLTTAGNLWGVGGPWQLEHDGTFFLQLDGALVRAIAGMAYGLGLPFGQPMGMYCPGIDIFAALHPA